MTLYIAQKGVFWTTLIFHKKLQEDKAFENMKKVFTHPSYWVSGGPL